MMKKIYIIDWDTSIPRDVNDASHLPFKYSDRASGMFLNYKYKDRYPKEVLFKANFDILPKLDYPLSDLNIPILNEKMIKTLKSIGDFEAFFTPVTMLEDTYLGDLFDKSGNLKADIERNDDYRIMTLINRENCFNYELSDFLPSELDAKKPGFIKKYVLNYSEDLPPIFRINESPSKIFLTDKAKVALEANGIKGCVFEEVEVTPYNS